MSEFVKIASVSELPAEGEAREFTCGGKVICVARSNGTVSALDNVCFHRGGPLGQGVVDGGKIVCPWHGWQFSLTTGEASQFSDAKVAVYSVKVDGEDVLVQF